jgi:hypothetical protein
VVKIEKETSEKDKENRRFGGLFLILVEQYTISIHGSLCILMVRLNHQLLNGKNCP